MVIFSEIMIEVWDHYKNTNNDDFYKMIVVDDIITEDYNTLGFS